MATQVLQHKCDQWASADAGIVRQDSPRASRPQAILKFRPLSSLDYKDPKFIFVNYSLQVRLQGLDRTSAKNVSRVKGVATNSKNWKMYY